MLRQPWMRATMRAPRRIKPNPCVDVRASSTLTSDIVAISDTAVNMIGFYMIIYGIGKWLSASGFRERMMRNQDKK